jgi:hypothetical protein
MNDKEHLSINLHMRLTPKMQEKLSEVAKSYGMKTSTLSRIILMRHLNDYSKNRLFA